MGNNSVRMLVRLLVVMMGAAALNVASVGAQSVAVADPVERDAKGAFVSLRVDGMPLHQVLKTIAKQAGLTAYYSTDVANSDKKVTVRLNNVRAGEAFQKVLEGTGVRASIVGDVVLFERGNVVVTPVAQGSITGKVIDGKTKQGLRGATVTLVGTNRGTTSGDNGRFRISNVVPGSYTIQVRMLGYVKATHSISILDGQTAAVEFILDPSVNALDQVVVTGTIVATAQKAVPNAMTIITAKDLEDRGITRIDQLFRGDVPGLFSLEIGTAGDLGGVDGVARVMMFSRGATTLQGSLRPQTAATNAIKTYIDGVEMDDPGYLNQIDPKSIERIEIIAGPQASTIYGSNAINGVMQIFTKRGTTAGPRVTLSMASGMAQNNLNSRLTPSHRANGQIAGVEGRWSYNVGGTWNYSGAWVPGRQTSGLAGNGGGRMQIGALATDVSIRQSRTQNRARGSTAEESTALQIDGDFKPTASKGRNALRTATVNGQTIGLTIQYAPLSWWSHELVLGADVTNTEELNTEAATWWPSDTLLYVSQSSSSRLSERYATTLQIPVASQARAVLSFGWDHWRTRRSWVTAQPVVLTGVLPGSSVNRNRPRKNSGGFFQGQFGVWDALFLTYGLRFEWNPNYGENAQPNLAPRYGIAYTREIGSVTAKLRASYGGSTRPPSELQRDGQMQTTGSLIAIYGPYYAQLPNPDLEPEFQRGGEGGLELYFGSHSSIVITRYNQTVEGLIARISGADSLRAPQPYPSAACNEINVKSDGYCYATQSQYLNVGAIRNQGWELQGRATIGVLALQTTYSWTKSRMIGITPRYRNKLSGTQYQTGFPFTFMPEHTAAATATYSQGANSIGFTVTGTGTIYTVGDSLRLLTNRQIRLGMYAVRTDLPSGYRDIKAGYIMADVNAARRFSKRVEGTLAVRNLGNRYENDWDRSYATLGRQTQLGLRIQFN